MISQINTVSSPLLPTPYSITSSTESIKEPTLLSNDDETSSKLTRALPPDRFEKTPPLYSAPTDGNQEANARDEKTATTVASSTGMVQKNNAVLPKNKSNSSVLPTVLAVGGVLLGLAGGLFGLVQYRENLKLRNGDNPVPGWFDAEFIELLFLPIMEMGTAIMDGFSSSAEHWGDIAN